MGDDKNIARNMLGAADLSGGAMHSVDPDKTLLSAPLEDGTVTRSFCTNCSSLIQLSKEDAQILADKGKFKLPDDNELNKHYIQVNWCIICMKAEKPEVELKKI